ncbi:hypothetical protein BGX30_006675, partial [Mortierella sp. GBA39]
AAVERHFSDEKQLLILRQQKLSARYENAKSNGQIKRGAFLFQIGRCEIDRDALKGEGEAAIFDAGPDTFHRFPDGGVRKSDNARLRQSVGNVDLHLNDHPVNSV